MAALDARRTCCATKQHESERSAEKGPRMAEVWHRLRNRRHGACTRARARAPTMFCCTLLLEPAASCCGIAEAWPPWARLRAKKSTHSRRCPLAPMRPTSWQMAVAAATVSAPRSTA